MKLRPFELGLVVFFGVLAVVALVLLRTISPSGESPEDEGYVGPVQIWGTLPATAINTVLNPIKEDNELWAGVSYRYVSPEAFNSTLIEALADGAGPDLVLLSHEQLTEQRRRIQPVTSWPLRDLQDTYLDGALIYALSDGVYGTPLLIDPLMMYWNKDILTNEGFLTPPKTWEELVNVQLPALVRRGFDRSVLRSVLAFGVYENTENGYGVLSTLLHQSGSKFVVESVRDGDSLRYDVLLNSGEVLDVTPLTNSLSFYLRFGQPANTLYSWNRSFASDRSEFISEDLVFYFGYASEARELETLNPNLSFDVAEVPQGAGADVRRTYGRVYALSPLRSADNIPGAFTVMSTLGSERVVSQLAEAVQMVPARRGLVAAGSSDVYLRVAYRSAPITYGWLNPEWTETDTIFGEMVSDVNENRSSVGSAVGTAQEKIRRAYE